MKRIMLILALVFSFGMTIAHAEIRSETDKFTGGKSYFSIYKADAGTITITKNITKNLSNFEVGFSDKSLSGEQFLTTPVEIKIDDQQVQVLSVKEASFIPLDTARKDGMCFIWNSAIVSEDIIEKIKVAKRVAIKAYKNKNSPVVIVLSPSVLTEWQQVINTEK